MQELAKKIDPSLWPVYTRVFTVINFLIEEAKGPQMTSFMDDPQ